MTISCHTMSKGKAKTTLVPKKIPKAHSPKIMQHPFDAHDNKAKHPVAVDSEDKAEPPVAADEKGKVVDIHSGMLPIDIPLSPLSEDGMESAF